MTTHGLHHVTAITGKAKENVDFYTNVLGLRLVKKTVNQDDTSAYHLFYADKIGSPGTDITFFDWPMAGPKESGTDTIATTMFRVPSRDSLGYWAERLSKFKVLSSIESYGPFDVVRFDDPEGLQLALINDAQAPFEGQVWDQSNVPAEHALRGFYAIRITVPQIVQIEPLFERLLNWQKIGDFKDIFIPNARVVAYGMDGGGPGKEVHVVEYDGPQAWNTAGSVHHAAFRVADVTALQKWQDRFDDVGLPNSGIVDRFYFRSLYFRITPGILFELATDGPGFSADEPVESLGERLSLPPFLEPRRQEIEGKLKPLS